MPRLFATNFANVGYDDVEREYNSTVEILTTGFIDLSAPDGMKNLYKKVMPKISSSSPEDLVVISGASVISGIIMHMWLKYHGVIRMLTFNRRANGGKYIEVIYADVQLSPDNNPD
jgi:hypothetical protein